MTMSEGAQCAPPACMLLTRGVVAQIKCEVERDPDETGGMKSRVHPQYKTQYRVRNWASYERALIGWGNITIWLSRAAIAAWKPEGTRTRGAPPKYSDLAIETALTLRLLFHLPLRQRVSGRRRNTDDAGGVGGRSFIWESTTRE